MAVSVFDLFKIGIGPSSSHTVGPMRAARLFVQRLARGGRMAQVARVRSTLYGSLGATGRGHASDRAVLLGLCGHAPDTVDVALIDPLIARIRWLFEALRPFLYSYVVESPLEGRPFARTERDLVYARAKGDPVRRSPALSTSQVQLVHVHSVHLSLSLSPHLLQQLRYNT